MNYYGVTRSTDHLAHYGVKGMRWGVRRALRKEQKQFYKGIKSEMKQSRLAREAARKVNGKADVYDPKYGGIHNVAKSIPNDKFQRYHKYDSAFVKASDRQNDLDNFVNNRFNHGGKPASQKEKAKMMKLSQETDKTFEQYKTERDRTVNDLLGKYAKKKIRVYSPSGYRRESAERLLQFALSARSDDLQRRQAKKHASRK